MKKKRKLLYAISCFLAAGALLFALMGGTASAVSIRLEKTEGRTAVLDHRNRSLTIRERMRLLAGYLVSTQERSAAYLSLDDARAAKMDALSRLGIEAEGRKLILRLLEGKLFFDIGQPLEGEEQLEIRTSTSLTGIREASGVLDVVNENTARICLFTGSAQISAVSPVTGEIRESVLLPGQQATILTSVAAQNEAQVEIVIDTFEPEDIPDFAIEEIERDPVLREQVLHRTNGGLTETILIPTVTEEEEPNEPAAELPEPSAPEPYIPIPEPQPEPPVQQQPPQVHAGTVQENGATDYEDVGNDGEQNDDSQDDDSQDDDGQDDDGQDDDNLDSNDHAEQDDTNELADMEDTSDDSTASAGDDGQSDYGNGASDEASSGDDDGQSDYGNVDDG